MKRTKLWFWKCKSAEKNLNLCRREKMQRVYFLSSQTNSKIKGQSFWKFMLVTFLQDRNVGYGFQKLKVAKIRLNWCLFQEKLILA